MKEFFTKGNEFRIKTVHMGYLHGRVWIDSKGEKIYFYRGLVSILIRDDLKKGEELISFMLRFPYKSMRQALEEETFRVSEKLARADLFSNQDKMKRGPIKAPLIGFFRK